MNIKTKGAISDVTHAVKARQGKGFNEVIIAAALGSSAYAFSLSGGLPLYLMSAISLLFIVFLWMFISNDRLSRVSKNNLFIWIIFVTLLISNMAVNVNNYQPEELGGVMMRVLGFSMLLFVVQWIAVVLDPVRVLSNLGFVLTPLILLAIILSITESYLDRASPLSIHPNWWGELTFCYTATALAVKSKPFSIIMWCLAIVLLYYVQARGALMASVVMLITYLAYSANSNGKFSATYLRFGVLTATLSMILIWKIGVGAVFSFIKNDLLLLDNAYRGIGTGLVGRVEGWRAAWQTFLENPIYGVGLDLMKNVHNGFLRVASEGGIILLVAVIIIIYMGVINSLKTKNVISLSIIVGYLALVLTYPRFLNMNLASTAFFLSVFSWKSAEIRNKSSIDIYK